MPWSAVYTPIGTHNHIKEEGISDVGCALLLSKQGAIHMFLTRRIDA